MKVAFATLGCRVNQYESEAMSEKFIKSGYDIVDFDDVADVYVINTCTVTNMSDRKSRQMISRAKKKNKNAIIAAVGCYSQIAPEKIGQIEDVDVVLGTRNKGDIVYWVNRAKEEKKKVIQVNDVLRDKNFEDLKIEEYQDKTRAFLKIQDGCNNFCSYCLIPFARGAVCSKSPETVIMEVKKLAEHGFKEIILSGIDISSYGVDLEGDWDLVKILQEIEKIDGINRIRIGSIGPEFFNDTKIEMIGKLKKLCPHFHLSLQSGCDRTLKRMNRKYNTEQYRDIVNKLRKHVKDVSITTDIIVGFPGENDDEFNETYNFLEELELSKMHIFKFSPRTGTKAEKMDNQVDGNTKDIRSKILLQLNSQNEKKFMEKFINKNMEVLYEQRYNDIDDSFEGYTSNYIKVVTKSKENLNGKIINTKLLKVGDGYILGQKI